MHASYGEFSAIGPRFSLRFRDEIGKLFPAYSLLSCLRKVPPETKPILNFEGRRHVHRGDGGFPKRIVMIQFGSPDRMKTGLRPGTPRGLDSNEYSARFVTKANNNGLFSEQPGSCLLIGGRLGSPSRSPPPNLFSGMALGWWAKPTLHCYHRVPRHVAQIVKIGKPFVAASPR